MCKYMGFVEVCIRQKAESEKPVLNRVRANHRIEIFIL